MLEPANLKEHRQSGKWWKRSYIGPHTPDRRRDPLFWDEFLPEPEMWHPEAIFWRRRCKLGKLMKRAAAGEDPMKLALEDAQDLGAEDLDRFWNELVPTVGQERRKSFDTLPELVAEVRERYDRRTQRALARLLGRLSVLLLARLEPLYLDRWHNPEMPAKTYLHLWMLVQHVIGDGRDAYLAGFEDPKSLAARLDEVTTETGLYYLSIFRFEPMIFEAQKLRLITAIMPPHDPEEKAKVSFSYEDMNGFEQFVARLAESFAGFFSVMPVIRDNFHGPRFNRGYPELYPTFKELDTGEVLVDQYAEPPEGARIPVGSPAE
jgi:hypothetical protein